MDVLTKLKNTVSTTVSQLSGVLPGNPVTREFEATHHIASAGPGLLWKIYDGHKKSTKQEAAIFVLEKRLLERYSKRDREILLDALRKGVAQLTRLRHPKILTVQHPLEESRESLAFATEPVLASLANVIGFHDNMPSPVSPELQSYQLYEVEIKYGILQLCDALKFLHGDVRLLHRNVCPESIIISKSGSWKLSGFEFCIPSHSSSDQQPSWPFQEWDTDIHPHAQPPLAFLAPEYALTHSCDAASDMYSLGAVIYSVFNEGKLLAARTSTYSQFQKHASELKNVSSRKLDNVPSEVLDHVKLLLNVTPELRPDAYQFSKIPFFDDVGAKTLEYLDSLFQWDNLQKSQFYKGLPQVITTMPKRVNLHRIIPCLNKEFVNPEMIPFVLPSVLLIAEDATKEEFSRIILPELRPVFQLQEPVQILLIFMQKMQLLLNKTPPEDIKSSVLPMVYRALESDTFQIQELCLNIIPNFAKLVDYPSMKNALLPRIKKLCLTTQYLSVRVNCLVCLGKLLEHLDKWLVLDDILPVLQQIPSREPAVLMGILGIYKLTMTHTKLGITKDVMATKVIPFLMPLTIESSLNLSQFNAIFAVVKEMVNQVETDHRVKLEQLNSMQQEQRSTLEMSKVHPVNSSELISGIQTKPANETDQMWQVLGLGSYVAEKDAVKMAEEFLPGAQTPAPMGPTANKTLLTLEEKENLARQQQRHQQLKTQPPLQPVQRVTMPHIRPTTTTATIKSPPKHAPRDLTDTLISSNLANMSLGRPTNPPSGANYYINTSIASSSFAPSPTFLPTASTSYGIPTSVPQTLSGATFHVNGTAGLQATPQQPNLSAFDNLFDGLSTNRNKVSMNQMPIAQRPAIVPFQSGVMPPMAPPVSTQSMSPFSFAIPPPPPPAAGSTPSFPPPRNAANADLSDLLG